MVNGSFSECFCLRWALPSLPLPGSPLPPCPPLLSPPSLADSRQERELASSLLTGLAASAGPSIHALFLEGKAMLGPGLSWTGQVAGGSGRPGAWLSHRLEWRESCCGLCSEDPQAPMDFGISQPLLLPLALPCFPLRWPRPARHRRGAVC